jgi:hypothetical protein
VRDEPLENVAQQFPAIAEINGGIGVDEKPKKRNEE